MSDMTQSPTALVISDDESLINEIVSSNTTSQTFNSRDSLQTALQDSDLMVDNGIVIFDIGVTGNQVSTAIDQILKLKQQDPTQVLFLVGNAEPLGEILKSNVQPLIYRAFNKPVSPNQIFLAFKSANALHQDLVQKQAAGEDISIVGPIENRTNVGSLAAQRKTNPAVFVGIGLLLLGVAAFLLFSGGESEDNTVVQNTPAPNVEPSEPIEDLTVSTVTRTNELNQLAATAILEGRYIAPKGDNALEYYDQVLAIDPYDSTAYEGKKSVAEALRASYRDLVQKAEFDRALKVINALQLIEPLNIQNDELHTDLEESIARHVRKVQASGSAEDVAKTTAVLEKIESEFEGSKSAAEALKREKQLVAQIDAALDSNNLIPPNKGNAYSLVSDALKGGTISRANFEPRIKALSAKLLRAANLSLETEGELENAEKLGALVKRLNVDRQGLAALSKGIEDKKAEIAAAKAASEAEQQLAAAPVVPEPPKIIPAKIIKREPPRYPTRALNQSIEGWVDLSFTISTSGEPTDIKVNEASPAGVFDKAAIRAVKKWRFSPARNQNTGLPVESTITSTKVQFKLS